MAHLPWLQARELQEASSSPKFVPAERITELESSVNPQAGKPALVRLRSRWVGAVEVRSHAVRKRVVSNRKEGQDRRKQSRL